jgi:hypothetical protein
MGACIAQGSGHKLSIVIYFCHYWHMSIHEIEDDGMTYKVAGGDFSVLLVT